MTPKTIDQRVERTRGALREAFTALVLDRRYEEIDVADILKRAKVGRSTFYEHFRGKDALLADSIAGPFGTLAETIAIADNTLQLTRVLEHFYSNRALARTVLSEPLRNKVAAVLVSHIEQKLKSECPGRRVSLILPMRLAAVQVAEILLAPITAWLGGDARCSARALAVALRRVAVAALAALTVSGASRLV